VSIGKGNKKIIGAIYILVVVIGYFALPELLKSLTAEQSRQLSGFNTPGIPNEIDLVSDREIISYKKGEQSKVDKYLVCSIDDDPDGMNAHGIYDPIDLAVTVKNLVRLDIKHLFLGTHAHWPELPSAENNTLKSQLELLDSCILSTPLRRSVTARELPEYLLNSSLSINDIQGEPQLLPVVNNLSLEPSLMIPSNCKVGFSQLESEAESINIPLLAVWGDRIVLSSLLLERMHQLRIELSDLDVILGKYIKLGKSGNLIPINEFGYFLSEGDIETTGVDIVSAEITSVDESPVETNLAILTASGEIASNYRTIENPTEQLSQLSRTLFVEDQVVYQRIPWWSELLVVLLVGFILCLLANSSIFIFWICAIALGIGSYFGSLVFHQETNDFIPILSVLVALFVCMLVRLTLRRAKKRNKNEDKIEDEQVSEIENPIKLMTLAEKEQEEENGDKEELPEEIRMLVEQLEGSVGGSKIEKTKTKGVSSKSEITQSVKVKNPEVEDDFAGDFCDLPEELKAKTSPTKKKKPDSKSN